MVISQLLRHNAGALGIVQLSCVAVVARPTPEKINGARLSSLQHAIAQAHD